MTGDAIRIFEALPDDAPIGDAELFAKVQPMTRERFDQALAELEHDEVMGHGTFDDYWEVGDDE